MHIVHLLDKFRDGGTHGGLSSVVTEETRHLVERGHKVTVIARRFSENVSLREMVDGVNIMRFDSANPAETFWRVRNIVQGLFVTAPMDVLHSHLAVVDLAAVRFLRKKVPVVRSFHGDWPVEVWSEHKGQARSKAAYAKDRIKLAVHSTIENLSMMRAKRIHVLSTFSKEYVMRKFGRRADDIEVIPPGINVARFTPSVDKTQLRVELGLPRRGQIALFAGRLIAWKGPDRIIAAFAKVAQHNSAAELVIAGGGREEASLRAQAMALGIDDRVHFVGFQNEKLPQYYAAADIVIVASTREETFGMVTAEALACGTPVLGTPFGATPEILGAIDENLVLKSSQIDDIAASLEMFFTGSWEASLRPERLRNSVVDRFSWDRHADRMIRFYEQVADKT